MRYIKIISKLVPVRIEPSKFGKVLCGLHSNVIVDILENVDIDGKQWIQISCGWFASKDNTGTLCYEDSNEESFNKAQENEFEIKRRISSVVSQMLTKFHGLPIVRRLSNNLVTLAKNFLLNEKSLMNVPDSSLEDIIISINATIMSLTVSELFEIVKMVSSQRADPLAALLSITTEIRDILALRPSLWVKNKLSVLETVDIRSKNDQFVMAAARGDLKFLRKFIQDGYDITAIHSELKYTAVHAAADFGSLPAVKLLIESGIPLSIRDGRLGRTPLHFAAQSGRTDIAQLIVKSGGDRQMADFANLLPFQVADENGYCECRELLKQPPPAIQHCEVTQCSDSSITLEWIPPFIHTETHAKVGDFVIIHEPVQSGGNESSTSTRIVTKENTVTVSGLKPSTGHGFTIFGTSVAGMSKSCPKLVYFTLPSKPDAPPAVELIKVARNGLVITWRPPVWDNGAKIDNYVIEMSTSKGQKPRMEEPVTALAVEIAPEPVAPSDEGSKSVNSKNTVRSGKDLFKKKTPVIKANSTFSPMPTSKPSNSTSNQLGTIGSSILKSHTPNPSVGPQILKRNISNSSLVSFQSSLSRNSSVLEGSEDSWGEEDGSGDMDQCSVGNESFLQRDSESRQNFLPSLQPPLSANTSMPSTRTTAASTKSAVNEEKWHRQIKHKDVYKREKYIMGLEMGRSYYFRVKAHNEFGWSEWSEWSEAFVPQEGLRTASVGDKLMKLQWVKPSLVGRVVSGFELQVCQPSGPKISNVNVFNKSPIHRQQQRKQLLDSTISNSSQPASSHDFVTLLKYTQNTSVIVRGLQPGLKYQFRVRPLIDDLWGEWSVTGVASEVITIPAAAPEAPFGLREFFSSQQSTVDTEEPSSVSPMLTELDEDRDAGSGSAIVHGAYVTISNSHNSATLVWVNGAPNGNPVFDSHVQMAKIREHRVTEVQWAVKQAAASGGATSKLDMDLLSTLSIVASDDLLVDGVSSPSTPSSSERFTGRSERKDNAQGGNSANHGTSNLLAPLDIPSMRGSGAKDSYVQDDLVPWEDVPSGSFALGPCNYKVMNLDPGATYVFRVRQRNGVGWGAFSCASGLIRTLIIAPPSAPISTKVSSNYAILQWHMPDEGLVFSILDFQIHIAILPIGYITDASAISTSTTRAVVQSQSSEEGGEASIISHTNTVNMSTTIQQKLDWWLADSRYCNQDSMKNLNTLNAIQFIDSGENNTLGEWLSDANGYISTKSVIVDKLSPMTTYITRVRVRTVAGWSVWSENSDSFRTLSPP